MFAEVDKDACIGCGACPEICPEIFKMEDDGLAAAYKNPVPGEFLESAKEAAEGCPTEAIHIEE
ncbi:MAG TPA: ferredoxin [Desulfosporosinus sp.]|nr:ferredoxin [Desulfosporosinus sp.]